MFRTTTRNRTAAVLLTATAALAAPAAAQAGPLHDHHASDEHIGEVVANAGARPLSLGQAKAAQAEARRSGRVAPAPRLVSTDGLRVAPAMTGQDRMRRSSAGAKRIRFAKGRPSTRQAKLFGYTGTYATKKWVLVNWVNYTFSQVLGGSFRQPRVYEVAQGGTTPNGCGPVHNASFCWGPMNTSGFSAGWSSSIFNQFGDAAFASIMAHEYGHGAMSWLGFAGRGWFTRQIYREGFADCMAGAWLYWMAANRHTDTLGVGDRNELHNVMSALGGQNATTTYDNHGDRAWRTALSTYGWNSGFNGCIAWGRQLAG